MIVVLTLGRQYLLRSEGRDKEEERREDGGGIRNKKNEGGSTTVLNYSCS